MFCPIHPKIKTIITKNQNNLRLIGRKTKLRVCNLGIKKGKNARQIIATTIATTPPTLCGIERNSA
jgi:hypothetical protein